MTLAVRIDKVTKTYASATGGIFAVEEVSLDIEEGEFVALLGPSGCGKSTLLMMMAGLVTKSGGTIQIGTTKVEGPYTNLGIVFQEANLLDWRTVMKNVMLQIEIRGLDPTPYRQRANELLRMVGLEGYENRHPYELSGGMQQRVSICRALLHDPPLLLMDEPFGALDALTRDQLNLDIQDIWMASKKTVLFVTHSISEAVLLADRVIVMTPRPGKIGAVIPIDLPRPRQLGTRETPAFGAYAKRIRGMFEEWGVLRQHGETGKVKP